MNIIKVDWRLLNAYSKIILIFTDGFTRGLLLIWLIREVYFR